MVKRVYVGPHDEVEIADTGQVVRRGDTVEVEAGLAERLDEQPSNWAKPTTSAAKNATAPATPDEPQPVTVDGQPIDTEETS